MTDPSIEIKLKKALENGSIMIYGAHLVAVELYRYLKWVCRSFEFAGFAVTTAEGNPKELEGEKVVELQDSQADKDTTVMIAMPEKYHNEVELYARKLGFSSFIRISLEKMSELKGRQLLQEYKRYGNLKFNLYEDECDVSWMNMTDSNLDRWDQPCDLARRHYKFPTLYYLDVETMFREAGKFNFYKDYERVFGAYRNLHALPARDCPSQDIEKNQKKLEEQLRIYMVFSQWDSASIANQEYPFWIYPIQAGSALTEKKVGKYLDEIGDSISEKNSVLAEMTAAYWIWKNAEPVKYKGLCHYRRHFVLTKEVVISLEENGIDVVLTTPRYAPGGIRRMFLAETPVKEPVYQKLIGAIADCHPEDKEAFKEYMEECLYCPNNMVIAKSGIYDAYCEWVFPVLFRMMEMDEESGYGHERDRHIAYAAELLTSWYFARHKDVYCMAVTDYRFYC